MIGVVFRVVCAVLHVDLVMMMKVLKSVVLLVLSHVFWVVMVVMMVTRWSGDVQVRC